MIALTMVMAALAADAPEPPPLPLAPEFVTVPDSCENPVDLIPGKPPPASLVDAKTGLVVCRAVALGADHAATLQVYYEGYTPQLKARWKTDVDELRKLYALDTGALERDLAWEREQRAWLVAELNRPVPLFERPAVARTVGRVETLGVVVAVGLAAKAINTP
jgi:hypothetical protein